MSTETQQSAPPSAKPFERWHRRILSLCLIVFALEIGLFLILFPWTGWWDMSYVPVYVPDWASIWLSRWFRGAITGLGLLDVFVALAEALRLARKASRQASS